MNFWIIAVILLAVSAAAMCWPLFTGAARDRITGILILIAIPLTGLLSYQFLGTPEALSVPSATPPQQAAQAQSPHSDSGGGDIAAMVAQLQQRMAKNPDDADGWLILGRTLKTMQRYNEALDALTQADRLVPGTPLIMVELAEAMLFASGKPEITPDIRRLLDAALDIDPHQQKGLWLVGMAASTEGDDALAIATWQKLLSQLEPGSGSANRVQEQIDAAQARLGYSAPQIAAMEAPVATTTVAESGIPVVVSLAGEFAGTIPGNAPLFVFIHPEGGAGMPLAVKRVAAQGFPMSLNFSDADLLRPGSSLKDFDHLDITARISLTGMPNATPGDIQAAKFTLDTKAVSEIALHLDQRVP